VPGYNSRQMLLRMEQLIGSAHPRLVVITLMPLWDAQRLEDPFVYKDGYIVDGRWANRVHLIGDNLWSESVDLPVIGPLSAQAKARSRLVRLALPAIHRALHVGEPPRAAATAGDEARAAETARQLSLAAQRASASGATLLAVLADSRNDAHIATRQRLETELDRLGVDYVELDRVLDQAAWRRLRHVVDGHWNRAGHAELAAILAPLIQARIAERPGVAPPAAAPAPAVAGAPG